MVLTMIDEWMEGELLVKVSEKDLGTSEKDVGDEGGKKTRGWGRS